jgi:uncharacterized membrane protein YgcG
MPDTTIYLQTAQDVAYDAAAPDQFSKDRSDLDSKRVQAMQRYLGAITAGRPMAFNVAVHDAPTQGIEARPIGVAMQRLNNNFQGVLPGTAMGGGMGGVAGGTPATGGGATNTGGGGGSSR